MKATRIIVICTLLLAASLMAVLVVKSVRGPIKFEKECEKRKVEVIDHLKDLRKAMLEYHLQNDTFPTNLDSLVYFLRTTPKKEYVKDGELGDNHLEMMKLPMDEAEAKAANIIKAAKDRALNDTKLDIDFTNDSLLYDYIWHNDKEVLEYKLQNFRRDTIEKNMIQTLYDGKYDENTIAELIICPYSNGQKFDLRVDNHYRTVTKDQILLPIFEISAPFSMYLSDLDKQELANLIDREAQKEVKRQDPDGTRKLKVTDVFTGLKVGSIDAPNNHAGNWE